MPRGKITDSLLAYAGSLALRLIRRTLTWKDSGLLIGGQHWSAGSPAIMVFWHSDQLMLPWAYLSPKGDSKPIHALVSMHSDGHIAAKILDHLSIKCIHGSSSRGGGRALIELKQMLKTGVHVAVTPDGPKGPNRVAKIGAVTLSSITGVPIFPVALAADNAWTFRSWDKMFLPKPFSRVSVMAGAPYVIRPDLSRQELEQASADLTFSLNFLKEAAENAL